MSLLKLFLLVSSAVAAVFAAEGYTSKDLCSNVASVINVIKEFTDFSINVDFAEGNTILHGPAKIQLTDDVTTFCEGLQMDEKTILFLGNIKDNITITFIGSPVKVVVKDCNIVAHITVTRTKAKSGSVTIDPRLIEVTDFQSVFVNGTELDHRFAEELVRPDLSKALSASDLGKTRIITSASGRVNPFLPKQLVQEIYQYYFYRLIL